MTDQRKLEKTRHPGIYRRHANGCKRTGRCKCSWVVRFKSRDGASHKQHFASLEEARQFKGDLDGGRSPRRPRSSETIGDAFPTWLESYRGRTRRGLEESSRREFETSFRLHIEPLGIARVRMRDLDAVEIKEWFAALERRTCSPNTIRKARAALAAMLADALEDGQIAANPAAGVRYVASARVQRQHPPRKHRELTAEDVSAILAAMPERWQAFFVLLTQSGVRIGELLGLTWDHVHLGDDAHIMVAAQFYKGERKRLKTAASMAAVPLSGAMASWLTELRPRDVAGTAPVFSS
jgi:integrase